MGGLALLALREYDEAEAAFQEALQRSSALYDRSEEMLAYYGVGRLKAFQGKFQEAVVPGNRARGLAVELGDVDNEFKINNLLSWTYFETQVDFNQVLEHEARQAELVRNRSELDRAHIYNNLGYDLTVAGAAPLDSAIKLMKFANSVYAEVEANEGRWYTLMNLTWQHRLSGDLAASKEFGEKSLRQAIEESSRHAVVEASFQLGETLLALGDIEGASTAFETGLKWRGLSKDRDRYVFDVYYGNFLWVTNKRKEAISVLEDAVNFLVTSEVFYEMHGRALLANHYMAMGQINQVKTHLDKIEQPRHNYIAMESKCLAGMARAELFARQQQPLYAKRLLENWKKHAQHIGALSLFKDLNQRLSK